MKNLIIPSLLLGALAATASAQTLTKAANNTNLNLAGSWVENTAPTSSNTLLFNGTWTPANVGIGASLSVNGLQITNVANGNGRISANGSNTLTIGAGGIDMSSATNNFRIDPAIILGADQSWSVASGRILNLVAAGMTGAFTANVTGAGTLAFDASGTATYGSQLLVNTSILRINFATTDVGFTNNNNSFGQLTLFNGTGRFSSIGNSGVNSAAGSGTSATQLGGSNTNGTFVYTGNTTASNRIFQVDRRSAGSAILVTTAGQTLTLSGNITHNLGNDTGVQNNAFRVGGEGNLTLNGLISNNSNSTFSTSLVKEGNGTVTLGRLSGNTFTGGVTVNAGTLIVNNITGSGTGAGAVLVAAGATLGGTGIIDGATTINGTLSPGNSVGIFIVNNTVTWNFNDAWKFELGTAGVDMNSTGTSDLLNITNGSFTKGTGTTFTIDFLGTGELGWYRIVDWTVGTTFVAGDFAATNLAGGYTANFVVDGATSALYLEVIPEPSTWALVAVAGTVLMAARRRRKV